MWIFLTLCVLGTFSCVNNWTLSSFYLGLFKTYLFTDFHGEWQDERMAIENVEPHEHRALLELHGQEMSNTLSNSMENSSTYFVGMFFLNAVTQRTVLFYSPKTVIWMWLSFVSTSCHLMRKVTILIIKWSKFVQISAMLKQAVLAIFSTHNCLNTNNCWSFVLQWQKGANLFEL